MYSQERKLKSKDKILEGSTEPMQVGHVQIFFHAFLNWGGGFS